MTELPILLIAKAVVCWSIASNASKGYVINQGVKCVELPIEDKKCLNELAFEIESDEN